MIFCNSCNIDLTSSQWQNIHMCILGQLLFSMKTSQQQEFIIRQGVAVLYQSHFHSILIEVSIHDVFNLLNKCLSRSATHIYLIQVSCSQLALFPVDTVPFQFELNAYTQAHGSHKELLYDNQSHHCMITPRPPLIRMRMIFM